MAHLAPSGLATTGLSGGPTDDLTAPIAEE